MALFFPTKGMSHTCVCSRSSQIEQLIYLYKFMNTCAEGTTPLSTFLLSIRCIILILAQHCFGFFFYMKSHIQYITHQYQYWYQYHSICTIHSTSRTLWWTGYAIVLHTCECVWEWCPAMHSHPIWTVLYCFSFAPSIPEIANRSTMTFSRITQLLKECVWVRKLYYFYTTLASPAWFSVCY